MGDEAGELPELDEAVAGQIATQMARLNANLERQFEVIEQQRLRDEAQREKDRVSARRRWYIVMAVVVLIAVGNIRVELVRREGDRRDHRNQAAQDLAACRRTNLSRAEIRGAFDQQGEALVKIAREELKDTARELSDDTHDRLAASLKSKECTQSLPAEYSSCAEAVADGVAPIRKGTRGYSARLDADGDGVACE